MRWTALLTITLLLTACDFSNRHVVEPLDIVVSQRSNALELGDNHASIDVTNTTIKSHQ